MELTINMQRKSTSQIDQGVYFKLKVVCLIEHTY